MPQLPDDVKDWTEAEWRAFLGDYHSPVVDAFRLSVRRLATSHLVEAVAHPRKLLAVAGIELADGSEPTDDQFADAMAVGLAIADEIDRRIPVPS